MADTTVTQEESAAERRALHAGFGTAFPSSPDLTPGITIRDYFAAACYADLAGRFNWEPDEIQRAADMSYQMADAMLQARAK